MTLQASHAAGVRPAVGAHLERSCHLRLRPGSCCETHVQLLQNGHVQISGGAGGTALEVSPDCVSCSVLCLLFYPPEEKHVGLPTLLVKPGTSTSICLAPSGRSRCVREFV